jgi:hypothetical protein
MFDHEWEPIPTNLDDLQPGPELGGVLACYDIDEVSPHDRITVLRAQQRQCSFDNAQLYRTMASIANIMDDDHPQYGTDAAAAEIQCALHLTRRATETELGFALELQRRLPRVWDALFDGAIDVRRAKTFNHATLHLPVGVARDVVERVIEAAGGLTTGELKARLDRVVIEADPDGAQDRYQHAVKGRRLIAEASVDGTANLLGLDLPPHRVNAASRRVNHIAKSLKTKDETRTMDQIRADVYLDLLLGKPSEGPNAGVHIRVDLDTLSALAEHPGELAGYGPVIADIARQAVAEHLDSEWRYTIVDHEGRALHDGTTRRRPTTALRRHVEARDQTCIFPGCRMPSVDCDIDHTTRWVDGGTTCECNQAPLCRHNHITKDTHGWTYHRLPNGDYQWISKLGHTYTSSGIPP